MSQPEENEKEQTLVDHLVELRKRLLYAVLLVLVIFAGLFYFSDVIYEWIADPLTKLLPKGTSMIATDVTSPFFAPFKLTLFASVVISMPFILHQAWAFISPGLYQHEKRLAIPLLFTSVILFYGGLSFAYFVVFPLVFGFFTSVGPSNVAVMTDISSYLNFVMKLFLAFGVVFEIPVATMLIIRAGITDRKTLAQKRPYVIVGCFVVGMLLTPPDLVSQSLLALPMWLLFESGLIMSRLMPAPVNRDELADEEEANTSNES